MPKILAVDDSATMRRIYEMTFAGQDGYEVVTVENGDQAVRHAQERGADLILADASMAPMSGYDVAKAIRAQGGDGTPILLLASQHSPFDAERARAAGIDDHILKPFDTQSLIDKTRDVLSRGRGGRAAGAPAARPVAAAAPVAVAPPRAAPAPTPAPAPAVGGAVAAARPGVTRATASFGAPMGVKPPVNVPTSAIVGGPARPAPAQPAQPAAAPPAARPAASVSAATAAASQEMAGKLSGMGLSPEQVSGILALSREVIERVVWEVVPEMAERMIRDEIKRLTS